jgi:Rv2258c-like winged HTH domain
MAIDHDKLQDFLGMFVGDLGATAAAGNVVIGHNLGLCKALAGAPATAGELAGRTGTSPRYVAGWLRGQAAGGYVQYDPASDGYSMTEERAFVLAEPDGAVYAPGAFVLALGALKAEPRITEAFRTGGGVGWHEHDHDVLVGCGQFSPAWLHA